MNRGEPLCRKLKSGHKNSKMCYRFFLIRSLIFFLQPWLPVWLCLTSIQKAVIDRTRITLFNAPKQFQVYYVKLAKNQIENNVKKKVEEYLFFFFVKRALPWEKVALFCYITPIIYETEIIWQDCESTLTQPNFCCICLPERRLTSLSIRNKTRANNGWRNLFVPFSLFFSNILV